jgi:hypothetical protein
MGDQKQRVATANQKERGGRRKKERAGSEDQRRELFVSFLSLSSHTRARTATQVSTVSSASLSL